MNQKYVLITGASRGIGRACALAFARNHFHVFLNCRHSLDALQQVEKEILDEHGSCTLLPGNAGNPDDVRKMFAIIESICPGLDVLVNNAGILSLKKPFVEYTKADWDKIFGINFMGDVFFCKAVIPTMKEKKAGRIINMASQSAETGGLAASPIYAASKAAVWCMTKSLAGEMGPYQVTVNAVAPGYIMTEMARNAGYRDDMVPMKRLGTPEDVADVVGFLASEDSRYVTGMIVDINGGTVMR